MYLKNTTELWNTSLICKILYDEVEEKEEEKNNIEMTFEVFIRDCGNSRLQLQLLLLIFALRKHI